MVSLPSKLFFRIGEVAGLVGVEPHVLRYWEREFRSIRPTKSAKGQRVYSRKDVENLLRVRDLLYRDGFTIAGAKKRLASPGSDANLEESTLPPVHGDGGLLDEALVGVIDDLVEDESEVPSSRELRTDARAKLAALRVEVEGFLEEIEDRRDQGEPA